MYNWLKKISTDFLSPKLKYQLEPYLRSAFGVLFMGNKYKCNVCSSKLSRFIVLESGDLLCPVCGSLPRQRCLWVLLQNEIHLKGKVLHFSPSRTIYRKLKRNREIEYISSDLLGEFLADKSYDITNIDEPSNTYDFIICFHVLEHIENDKKAMTELFRILKKGGAAIIQTPFKEGSIYEDFSIRGMEDRKKHFGQEDHVRIYSVPGLIERLTAAGFQVIAKEFDINTALGLKEKTTILIGMK